MATRVGLRFSNDCFRLVADCWELGVLGVAGCGSSSQNGPPSTPQPQVTVSSGSQVRLGSTAQFTATVTGETNTAVTWQVNGINGRLERGGDDLGYRAVYAAGYDSGD
jgi:hypothetical protein